MRWENKILKAIEAQIYLSFKIRASVAIAFPYFNCKSATTG